MCVAFIQCVCRCSQHDTCYRTEQHKNNSSSVTACMWSLQMFQVVLRVASDELLLGCLNSAVFWLYLLITDHLLCLLIIVRIDVVTN